jgi:PAS domain S-box-containing protein
MAALERPPALSAEAYVAELEREVAKLNKVRKALIGRVERSMDVQGSAFSLFQTAIVLEAQIRARTRDLERTLADLERSYRDVAAAREQAETARLRLLAAIESISDGFALFDADDRLVQFNQTYLLFWPGLAREIHPGMSFAEIVNLAVQRKGVIDAYRDPEGWARRRLRQHAECRGPSVHALADGRWMQINERRTEDGGIVSVYTDITDLKHRETRLREAELAKKTNLLQATLDNIFQGVAVYDRGLVLVAWNNEFLRLLDLPQRCVRRGATFGDFRKFNDTLADRGIVNQPFLAPEDGAFPLKFEHGWHDGRVIEIERNPMPDGGFVLTFTDITAQRHTEEALRDGERRIRLITDATPALIAYVDREERYQFVNEPYRRWLDRPVETIIGRRMDDVLHPEFYGRRKDFMARALGGETVEFEAQLTPAAAADPRYAHVTFVPHVGGGGRIIGFFTLMQDITEQRRITAAIKEANESLERRVEERTAALTRLNAQLQQEIAERREMERALQAAKHEAEQANIGKTRFLAAASHDLMQPLHSARLFISAMGDLKHTRQNRSLIDNADASLRAVEDLLGALLDISKLDAGALSHEITDFPISTLLGPLNTEHIVLARERGLTMRYVPSTAIVRSDIRMLRRIIQNFLTNAIRYTTRGGVLLGCRHREAGLLIEVRDTGPGIPAHQLDEIFEEFKQLRPGGGRHDAGVGLGLAIVKRAAKTLNLPIHTSSVLGRGSVFGITVPYGSRVAATAPTPLPPRTDRVSGRLSRALLLVVDDQPSVLAGMQALLAGWGCDVVTAASGREAIDALPRLPRPPDVVIADYHLGSGANGVKIVSRIRRATGQALPAIVVTADQTDEVKATVKQHGYWLLQKPLNPAQLRSLLSMILA